MLIYECLQLSSSSIMNVYEITIYAKSNLAVCAAKQKVINKKQESNINKKKMNLSVKITVFSF